MIDPSSCGAQDNKFLISQRHSKTDRNLGIGSVLYRIVLPYGHIRLILVIIPDLLSRTVKITHDIIRHDLMIVQELYALVHPDHTSVLLLLKNRKGQFFIQFPAADNYTSFTHILSVSP